MYRLDPRSRAALATLAVLCFAAAFALTPNDAQSALPETVITERMANPEPADTVVTSDITPMRDPFLVANVERPSVPAPMAAFPPTALTPLPSNLSETTLPTLPLGQIAGPTERVSAIISGPHPYALVTNGNQTRLVSAGDALFASRVTAISIDGVTLANGLTIHVEASTQQPLERIFAK
jgi:hypothetical protein